LFLGSALVLGSALPALSEVADPAPSQVFTPPWFEHAPCCDLAVLQVPSLHSAVAFAGLALAA
jgi:hypothetical protein